MLRILIVDDHAVVREGLKRIIDEQPGMCVAAEAANAASALLHLRAAEFDVAIVDLNLPDRDGMQLLGEIKRRWPRLRVLILSFHSEEVYASRALRAGADAYITKDSGTKPLLGAIARVTGCVPVTPAAQAAAAQPEPERPAHELLSAREFEVLRLLASGLRVSEVATRLALSVKTVSTYRLRLLEKLELHTNAQLMRYALEHRLLD